MIFRNPSYVLSTYSEIKVSSRLTPVLDPWSSFLSFQSRFYSLSKQFLEPTWFPDLIAVYVSIAPLDTRLKLLPKTREYLSLYFEVFWHAAANLALLNNRKDKPNIGKHVQYKCSLSQVLVNLWYVILVVQNEPLQVCWIYGWINTIFCWLIISLFPDYWCSFTV